LTKIDNVSDYGKDFTSVFKDFTMKHTVQTVFEMFGVPRINILPVKNYEEETEVESDVDILALLALRRLQQLAMDHLDMVTSPEVSADSASEVSKMSDTA